MSWFLTSKLGRSLLIGAGIALVVWLTKWYVEDKAYDRGYAACQAEHNKATDEANRDQAKREGEQREGATAIAKESTEAATRATQATDAATAKTNEVIRYVYREPITPAVGCVPHPLDDRVQDRLREAVDRANRAGSSL